MAEAPQRLEAGRIGRPHGLDGSFYVTRPRPGLLDEGSLVRVGEQDTKIIRRSGTDAKPILRLELASTREAIEALRERPLTVPRSAAPPLDDEEWYAADLVGCEVVDSRADVTVGHVRELLGLPSCEALAVPREGAAELLVPLVRDCVRSVDVAGARIDIDLAFLGELP